MAFLATSEIPINIPFTEVSHIGNQYRALLKHNHNDPNARHPSTAESQSSRPPPSIWRCRWYPGAIAPKHLIKAGLAGSYGFDPLRLGTDPEQLAWYAEAEKTNGRWAMAAVAGVSARNDLSSNAWSGNGVGRRFWGILSQHQRLRMNIVWS